MKCDYYRLEPDGLIDKVTFWMWNELLYKPKTLLELDKMIDNREERLW